MPREHNIPLGPVVASVGALMLLVSLFLDWYERVTGWTVFELADLLLAGLALWTLFGLAGALGLVRAADSAVAVLAPALLALAIVLTQIVNDPPAVAGPAGPEKDIGIWLALGGAGLMALGAVLATTHISLFVEARERDPGAGEDAPEPAAPPAAGGETVARRRAASRMRRRAEGGDAETGDGPATSPAPEAPPAGPGGPERP